MTKTLLLHQGREKKAVSILSDDFCEEQAFPYLIPMRKFGCNAPRVFQ